MTDPTPSPATTYLVSLVRTWVPIAWGALIAWLVGINLLDVDSAAAAGELGAGLATIVAAVAAALFYALVRLVEPLLMRIPIVGPIIVRLLIGSPRTPEYSGVRPRHLRM